MILAHASWHASSPSFALTIVPPSLPHPLCVSLSFSLCFSRSAFPSTLVHLDSFHPRLSRRAQWAVTKIDFCKGGWRKEREIGRVYRCRVPVSTSRFRPTRALVYIYRRFYPLFPLLSSHFRGRFREPRQIFHAIDKKETRESNGGEPSRAVPHHAAPHVER